VQKTIRKPDSGTDRIEQIEARLDHDRAALAQAARTLRLRLSGPALMREGLALAADLAGGSVRAAAGMTTSARWPRPVALGLAAMGLAWLTFGRGTRSAAPHFASATSDPVARWEDDGGMVHPTDTAQRPPSSPDWLAEADRVRTEAVRLLASLRDASDGGISTEADLASLRVEVLAALTADVRNALARGLEDMPEATRKAALLAREDLYARHLAGPLSGAQLMQERPLVSGVLAFATGVAAGLVLPRSTIEDRELVALKALLKAETLRLLQEIGLRQVTAPPRD
jgi:hypothetical protein